MTENGLQPPEQSAPKKTIDLTVATLDYSPADWQRLAGETAVDFVSAWVLVSGDCAGDCSFSA